MASCIEAARQGLSTARAQEQRVEAKLERARAASSTPATSLVSPVKQQQPQVPVRMQVERLTKSLALLKDAIKRAGQGLDVLRGENSQLPAGLAAGKRMRLILSGL